LKDLDPAKERFATYSAAVIYNFYFSAFFASIS